MQSSKNKYVKFILYTSLVFVFPVFIFAQSVSLKANKTSYTLNESILVTAVVDTGGQSINTVSGSVKVALSNISVTDIRYGNSIISLWVDKPVLNTGLSKISFTGGIPGGFSGSSGNLFSFVVKAKSTGPLSIGLEDVKVLLNDGSGGELAGLRLIPLSLSITEAPKKPEPTPPKENVTEPAPVVVPKEEPVIPEDKVAPESFVPMVSRHESIADNAYFASFFAVDKDSGVARYEIRERPSGISLFTDYFSTKWEESNSPYVLKYQKWGTSIEIKAYDTAGNFVVSKTNKPFAGSLVTILFVVAILLTAITTRILSTRKPHRKSKHII